MTCSRRIDSLSKNAASRSWQPQRQTRGSFGKSQWARPAEYYLLIVPVFVSTELCRERAVEETRRGKVRRQLYVTCTGCALNGFVSCFSADDVEEVDFIIYQRHGLRSSSE